MPLKTMLLLIMTKILNYFKPQLHLKSTESAIKNKLKKPVKICYNLEFITQTNNK